MIANEQEFRSKLAEVAKKSLTAAPRCANEESTKLFLVLPIIYDHTDPNEVFPEHHCDFSEKYKNRVDFAIFKDSHPVIAIECKTAGATTMKDDRGQLRSYFNAAKSVKMGILTDGLVWEFYADTDEPNIMDDNPFLRFDIADIAKGKIDDSVIEGFLSLSKPRFDPENIGAEAKRKHIHNSVLMQIAALADEPTEPFMKMLLQAAGLGRISQKAMDEYKPTIKSAFREFINRRILHRLDIPKPEAANGVATPTAIIDASVVKVDERVLTSATELEVYEWAQQRLAYLVDDHSLFSEIKNVHFKDYQGKFVVFYKMERKGRLFEFYESKGDRSGYRFVFPDECGVAPAEQTVVSLTDIDGPLLDVFKARVHATGR